MELDEHVRQVRDQLAAAAALGDDRTREVAASLATSVGPAVRLAVMSALAAAADEITAALLDTPAAPAVSVRLDGEAVQIDVTAGSLEPAGRTAEEGELTARISLRLSESLKAQVEQAANRDGLSVNTWLVRAASQSLSGGWGGAGVGGGVGGTDTGYRGAPGHRISGWVNG